MTRHFTIRALLIIAGGCSILGGCGAKSDGAPASAASAPATARPGGGAPVSVSTQIAKQRDFDVVLEAVGTVTPVSSVDVKPQVSSVVTRVHVQEGQFVHAGEVLFTLDNRADETSVAKARAQLVKDDALLADARRQLVRSRDLVSKNFVSQGALDTSQTQVDAQVAAVAADRAAIDAAQVSLSYTTVKAPGSGRLGSVNVYPGTSVQANQTTLVTLTQLDPINVAFSLPQSNLALMLAGLKSGGAVVKASLPDAKVPLTGRLQFVDNAVDAATGTVKVKARFANTESKLWPGAFLNVSFVAETLKGATVIPTASVIQSARGPMVYLADKGRAVARPVKVLAAQGEEVAVSGVSPGDHVVLEGRQNLRPDTALVERSPEAKAPARPASSASSAS